MKTFTSVQAVHVIYLCIAWLCNIINPVYGETVALNDGNVNNILGGHDIVFVNFYADWCRFSQILAPIFEEASNKIRQEVPEAGRVAFGKVDCDREVNIATTYRISKYPTLKLFRNGQVVKKEFRGQRSADSIANFIREQMKDSVIEHTNVEDFDELDTKKRHVIGYFDTKASDTYKTFTKVASSLRDDCVFHAAFGPASVAERSGGDNIVFRPANSRRQDIVYMGSLVNFDTVKQWTTEKCVPFVREITFENAEELTEEGLPFLILFHKSDDTAIVDKYHTEVARQLSSEKTSVNFLTADGSKFTHPLHHLGKTLDDLPVLAIDSFRHMYVFPGNVREDMSKPGVLKAFIDDLHSGKLHREFHHGPDPTSTIPPPPALGQQGDQEVQNQPNHIPKDASDSQPVREQPTSPPESAFRKLGPSRNRYTILRDEL
ncbi:hypothetical protein SNE40_023311 [Patella caerulea]|uniref:Thioredoxin domain-containing protein n=1 Tax=Patella caerulea TaxID=87958 RepID=A0AAN8FY90_PATCE